MMYGHWSNVNGQPFSSLACARAIVQDQAVAPVEVSEDTIRRLDTGTAGNVDELAGLDELLEDGPRGSLRCALIG